MNLLSENLGPFIDMYCYYRIVQRYEGGHISYSRKVWRWTYNIFQITGDITGVLSARVE